MRPGKFVIMTIATVAGGSLLFRKLKVSVPGFH
jgi:hypothetical protein